MYPEALAAALATLALSLLGASSVAWANQPMLPPGNAPQPPGNAPLPNGAPTGLPALPTTEAPGAVAEGAERFIPPTADAAPYQDVHSDSLLVAPTALTPPQGSFSVQTQEVFFLSASYGVTDQVQLTGMTFAFPGEGLMAVAGGLKVRLVEADRLRLALQGAVVMLTEESDSGESLANGGVIATMCLDRKCHSLLNGYAGILVHTEETDHPLTLASVGAVIGLSRHIKVLTELDTVTEARLFSDSDEVLLLYGMRLTGSRVGFDFGFVRPIGADSSDDIGPGVPYFKLTWRMR